MPSLDSSRRIERRDDRRIRLGGGKQREQHCIERKHHGGERDDERHDQPTRLAPRCYLPRIEIHVTRQKLTLGASRASGLAMSSSCAGWKLNMPATRLLGNTSRALL